MRRSSRYRARPCRRLHQREGGGGAPARRTSAGRRAATEEPAAPVVDSSSESSEAEKSDLEARVAALEKTVAARRRLARA